MSAWIEVARGDITEQSVDAIVNAANSSLMGGGGVDGAIHAAAGSQLLSECQALRRDRLPNGLPVGRAVTTGAGHLRARFVIHTVGPKYWEHPDGGVEHLVSAHLACLAEADRVGALSVAFPAISCGVYGWQPADAAPIAVQAVRESIARFPNIHGVRFVLFNDETYDAFSAALAAGSN
jgi:O-acetyl-ADP-ribose deacetylase (regulator of RNase III)